jgi:hypothetical protein
MDITTWIASDNQLPSPDVNAPGVSSRSSLSGSYDSSALVPGAGAGGDDEAGPGMDELRELEMVFARTLERARTAVQAREEAEARRARDAQRKASRGGDELFVPGRVCLFGAPSPPPPALTTAPVR